jgi:hypothetical protein
MLPLLPIFLIAKLSTLIDASTGELSSAQLDEYGALLKSRDYNLPELLQGEVDLTAGLLVSLHSTLVLLQASAREFNAEGKLRISSFTPDFVEKDAAGQVISGSLPTSTTLIADKKVIDPGYANLLDIFIENYGDSLAVCFKKVKTLPAPFDVETCLNVCRQSVQLQPGRELYLEGALQLIRRILLSADLEQVKAWTQPNPPGNVPNWLKQRLEIEALKPDLAALAASPGRDEVKISLSRIRALIDQDSLFFTEALKRLSHKPQKGDDLQEAIQALPGALADDDKKTAWENLQSALYGAVAWHLYRQANLIAQRVRLLLMF